MKNILCPIDNQHGTVMLFALLIMATLAIAGLMSVEDSVVETQVARNYAINKQCIKAAEAAALELGQHIDSIASIDTINNLAWCFDAHSDNTWEFDTEDWETSYGSIARDGNIASNVNYIKSTQAIAVLKDAPDLISGAGLGSGQQQQMLYTYDIYGRAVHAGPGNTEVIIKIGYRRRI
ncbi:MAG: hypothetical protein SWH61_04895 [Thermodesulfobacteriota bacterium]|nr:hypothetical protein [Thermodesulfobacteriota bacterium]